MGFPKEADLVRLNLLAHVVNREHCEQLNRDPPLHVQVQGEVNDPRSDLGLGAAR